MSGNDQEIQVTINSTDNTEHRQTRWHDVHDRLFTAACELFLESDYASTSMEDIADRANVVRKTAFNHYPRKRDIIFEWGIRRRQKVLAALEPDLIANAGLEVVLRRLFAGLATINLEERPLTICMSAGWREQGGPFDTHPHTLLDVFRGFLGDAIDRGEIPTSIDQERMGTVLYSSYFGLLYDWCNGSEDVPPFDLKEAFDEMLDIVMGGLRAFEENSRLH